MAVLSSAAHLARRFFGALDPAPPPVADAAWALARLNEGERRLWERMSGPDQRHAVAVARRVVDDLGPDVDPAVQAAGLLHDVGKVVSGLGTFARVGATLVGVGTRRRWSRGRVGEYLRHDGLGADLLAAAGSHPLTVAWAREHHLPESRWTVPIRQARALKAADDD